MSIQTSLTGRSILAEKRRKKKNQKKEKVKSFVVEETNRAGQKMGIDGIGICSYYISWPALRKRELGQKWSDKGGDGVAPPSCSQSLSHLLCQICAYPMVCSWRKNSWPTSTWFEGGKQDFSSSKEDAAGILLESRHRWISTSAYWRMDARDGYMLFQDLSGLKMCSDRIWMFLVSH